MTTVVERLVASSQPSIRYKILVNVLGEDPDSEKARKLRNSIRSSPQVRQLLSGRAANGKILCHPYTKWYGPHWVLADLADLHYPEGDRSLIPLREQEFEWLFFRNAHQDSPIYKIAPWTAVQ